MATSLITEIPTLCFSSQLRDIKLATDLDRLVVELNDGGTEVYRATIYAFEGEATVYDVRDIVELYMLDKQMAFTAFTISYRQSDGTHLGESDLNTVYCSHVMPVEAGLFASYNFLTTLASKRTSAHSIEFLTIMHGEERAFMKAHCVYRDDAGDTATAIVDLLDLGYYDFGIDTIMIKYDDIVQRLEDAGVELKTLLSYTITWGERVFTYYVHDARPDVGFTFRNCFNVIETVSFCGITTSKTKVERSVATARSEISFYDQRTTKEYEVQSSPLTMDEARWIEQLFISRSVRLGIDSDFSSLPEVLIIDSSCEISDSNADMNRVKFTWRFQDSLPHNIEVEALEDRIYQEQFTHQYQ